ncbi:MAG: hypothetical protein CMJ75_16325 [Planctomycetaceae bacterium]|nr:hypothetical protein [Planctomycetaceae bacterium]
MYAIVVQENLAHNGQPTVSGMGRGQNGVHKTQQVDKVVCSCLMTVENTPTRRICKVHLGQEDFPGCYWLKLLASCYGEG